MTAHESQGVDSAVMDKATNRFITEWLTHAHPHPDRARTEWATQGVALLPLGERFCAVRLTSRLVHAALGTDDPKAIAEELAFRLRGSVIHDTFSASRSYYALIQPHAGLVWDNEEDATCLGNGTYLGVPRINRVKPPGTYWLVPPQREGDLCRPDAVQRLVQQGQAAAAAADEMEVAS